jgi:hypothetical protein
MTTVDFDREAGVQRLPCISNCIGEPCGTSADNSKYRLSIACRELNLRLFRPPVSLICPRVPEEAGFFLEIMRGLSAV